MQSETSKASSWVCRTGVGDVFHAHTRPSCCICRTLLVILEVDPAIKPGLDEQKPMQLGFILVVEQRNVLD